MHGKVIIRYCELCGKELKKSFARFCTFCGRLYADVKRTKSALGLSDAEIFKRVMFREQWRKFRNQSPVILGVMA